MNFSAIKRYIDGKLILLLAGFYALFDIVFVIRHAFMRQVYPSESFEPWFDFLVYNILIDFLVVVTYMSLIAISTKRFLNKNYSWLKIISIHTILSLMIGLFIRLIFDLVGILTGEVPLSEYQFDASLQRFMFVIHLNFLIYFAMVFIIYTYYYVKQVKQAEQQKGMLEAQLVNTRMKMLSAQLQPHFLFNTLNSIAVLADLDKEKAKDTIADLSDFLREILYTKDDNEITVEKELRTLEYYLNILNVRFSDHLTIRKEIDTSLLNKSMPALVLQPLIENSIKHGYSYDHTDLEIVISVQTDGEHLLLSVRNNGQTLYLPHSELLKKGVGLANLDARLKNLYDRHYCFQVVNLPNGVETRIKIPLK